VKKVLLVEDVQVTRSFLKSLLSMIPQVEVVECQNGLEAMRYLPTLEPDLIVTDLNMPDINGLEFLRFVQSNPRYKGIRCLVVTTETDPKVRQTVLGMGVDGYLTKPFSPDQFQGEVKRLLFGEEIP